MSGHTDVDVGPVASLGGRTVMELSHTLRVAYCTALCSGVFGGSIVWLQARRKHQQGRTWEEEQEKSRELLPLWGLSGWQIQPVNVRTSSSEYSTWPACSFQS